MDIVPRKNEEPVSDAKKRARFSHGFESLFSIFMEPVCASNESGSVVLVADRDS